MNQLNIFLNNLEHNYKVLRSHINNDTELIAVLKASAYGSEIVRISNHLESLGVNQIAVAYVDEGVYLRKQGVKIPILVFYPQEENFEKIIKYNLEPSLYSIKTLIKFKKIINLQKKIKYPVHIKYNTGLNRIGFKPEKVKWIHKEVQDDSIHLKSVYSHLASSESSKKNPLSIKQINLFLKIKEYHQNHFVKKTKFHLLNSSGVFNYPEYQFNAVRCGIALHGYANKLEWDEKLKPIAELTSTICQIHRIKKGSNVGYDNGWIATKDSSIATLPIGHADGIGRHFGKQSGYVSIKGKLVPIVGNICMDMLMIDITDIECKEGDIVSIFGKQNNASVFAKMGDTISYELLTSLGKRVKRVIHK